MSDGERLAKLAEEYWDRAMQAAPSTATILGDHRYDDQLERLDPQSLEDVRAGLVATADEAERLELDDAGDRLTRELLVHEARTGIAHLDIEIETGAIDPFLGLHGELLSCAAQTGAATPEQAEQLLARYAQVPRLFDEVAALNRDRLGRGLTPAAICVERVMGQIEGYLAGPVDDDPFVSISVPDGTASDWRDRMATLVSEVVRPAYADHLEFIRDVVLPAARDDDHAGLAHLPGGDRIYKTLADLHTSLDVDPDEIHEIGVANAERELPTEWAAIGQSALGLSELDAIFDRLRTDPELRYGSAEEMVSHAEEIVARSWEAIDGWFNARPEAPCQVQAVPAALAPAMPPAYYYPAAEDGSRPGTYFINTHEATERGRYSYEAIAFHEAIPGHHFDRTLAQELTDVPTFRRYGISTAHAEGWGLYTERLGDEMGLYSSDLDRLGMLSADAWRAGRLVVDTGLHAKGWTRQQAIDWFVKWTPVPEIVVAQEIDRYIGMAGQALSYKVGQRHILGLRAEAQAALGDRFDIAAFHDAVLVRGGMPLTVLTGSVREQLGLS
jgi:uncharacterized protein (DUF885 family)